MMKMFKVSAVSAVLLAAACGTASADPGEGACPPGVTWSTLVSALQASNSVTVTGGLNNPMWGVVVNRNGTVCAVAYSGTTSTSQWLLSRQIAAAKAFTANGLSLNSPKKQWATSELDALVQPGKPLFGVQFGNLEDTVDAYKSPFATWGTVTDPMVGRRLGGMITFGGGVSLVDASGVVWGGLGVSGDVPCRDDAFARKVRTNLAGGIYDHATNDGTACTGNASN